jgi:uncharacterized protein YecT (DUF1311 family)
MATRSQARRSAIVLAAALSVPAHLWAQDGCRTPQTQAEMNRCGHDELLAARQRQAQAVRELEQALAPAQRKSFRESQRAWARWRTVQCEFESSASAGGSVRPLVESRCATRLTEARTAEIARLSDCPEGDLGCPRRPR